MRILGAWEEGHSFVKQIFRNIYCVPSLVLEAENVAVNKRNKSFALMEITLLNCTLKDHAINKVKTTLEAQRLVKKQLDNCGYPHFI